MQNREKILLAGFTAVLLIWQGGGMLQSLVFGPIRDRSVEIERLDKDLKAKREAKFESDLAARRLADRGKRSLPPDPLVASAVYHHWLIELANNSKFENASVTPNQPVPKGDVYHTIPFVVKGRCSLAQLCDFLYAFSRANLLQAVTRMTIEHQRPDADTPLEVTLYVEGLALRNIPSRTVLFAPKQAERIAPEMAEKKREDYAEIVGKNLFLRGYNGPPPPPPPKKIAVKPPEPPPTPPAPPPPPPFDPTPHVYLIAALADGTERVVWFYDRTSDLKTVLAEGAAFKIANLEGRALAIGSDYVSLQINEDIYRLELGQNLKQLRHVGSIRPEPIPPATSPETESGPAATEETVPPKPPVATEEAPAVSDGTSDSSRSDG